MNYSQSELSPQYSCDNFVVGPCNLFAHSAALGVAKNPAEIYNPLFLYGGVGMGKTHLMQAIGRAIGQRTRSTRGGGLKSMYLSTESFTNQLISAIQNGSTKKFRERFRTIDILLVDDIHFIAGKDATQEEFFHTFNALHDKKKQIVISSDRPPKDIPTLEERLISRFEWGLVVSLQPPDFETRIAILRKKAENCRNPVPEEIIELIARRITSNIRELEGALTRVLATASVRGEALTLRLASEALKDSVDRASAEVTLEKIQRASARFFGIRVSDLTSSKRSRSITFPRQIAMYLCRELTTDSLYEIGRAFQKKDHTTVLYACRKIESLIASDRVQAALIESVRREIETEEEGKTS